MKIDRENYPLYFLDYFEGRLSKADEADLFAFLGLFPDLLEEFNTFSPVSLPGDDAVVFPEPEKLKRGMITLHNYEWYFAAYTEGDLNPSDRLAVESFVANNPDIEPEFRLYRKVVLDSSLDVEFPGKASLKRNIIVPVAGAASTGASVISIRHLWRYASVAAVLMLMAGLFFLRFPDQPVGTLVSEHSVVTGGDDPVAVAEAPSRQRDLPGQQSLTPGEQLVQGSNATPATRTSPSVSASMQAVTAIDQPSHETTSYLLAERVAVPQAAAPREIHTTLPIRQTAAVSLDYRTEFAYWSPQVLAGNFFDEFEETEIPPASGTVSLGQLAMNRLQKALPVDFSKAEEKIANNRLPLWQLAGMGLSELGVMAGNVLGLETQTNEDGRLVLLSLGDRFEARRSR